jgi:hypothetical protein
MDILAVDTTWAPRVWSACTTPVNWAWVDPPESKLGDLSHCNSDLLVLDDHGRLNKLRDAASREVPGDQPEWTDDAV